MTVILSESSTALLPLWTLPPLAPVLLPVIVLVAIVAPSWLKLMPPPLQAAAVFTVNALAAMSSVAPSSGCVPGSSMRESWHGCCARTRKSA